jgi:hypothetical protein
MSGFFYFCFQDHSTPSPSSQPTPHSPPAPLPPGPILYYPALQVKMKVICVIISMVALMSAAMLAEAVPCADEHGQCGGATYTGPLCCTPGNVCTKVDAFYSQCREVPYTGTCVPKWLKCGGDGTPFKCCQPGYFCKQFSNTYAQCVGNNQM